MKTFYIIISSFIIALLLQACASSTPYAYDDVYYNPNNDPVKKVQKDPREDFNKTDNIQYDGSYKNRYEESEKSDNYPQSLYQNRYTEAEQRENQQPANNGETNITINNNNNDQVEYYDEEYAETLNRINSPVRNFNSYDPYTRDRILYTQDPFFTSPTLYGRYTFWDPFVPRTGLSFGYNSWSGWNVGVGFGLGVGYGYNNWGYSAAYPFYDPFYSPYYDPFWGYNRFSPWGPTMGYGYNNYWNGYNHGFYNGLNYGNYYGNGYYSGGGSSGESSSSGRRYINSPRGNSGSTTYRRSGENSPTRQSRTNPDMRNKAGDVNKGTRPSRTNSRPTERNKENANNTRENTGTRSTRTSTPEKYQIDRTPSSYSRPEPSSRPSSRPSRTPSSRPSTTPRNTTSPNKATTPAQRPSYSRPRNNSYNRPSRVQPQRSQPTTRPQPQSNPSYNRSRPSYNNTPTYSNPSRGGSSAPSSSPSRGTRPRR